MLQVTARAKEKLKERLEGLTEAEAVAIRIIASSSSPGKLEMVFDKEKDGDHVVENSDGMKLLLIGSDLVSKLEEMVIDFRTTDHGEGFAIAKLDASDAEQ